MMNDTRIGFAIAGTDSHADMTEDVLVGAVAPASDEGNPYVLAVLGDDVALYFEDPESASEVARMILGAAQRLKRSQFDYTDPGLDEVDLSATEEPTEIGVSN